MRIWSVIAVRLSQIAPVILLATFIVFTLVNLVPGDPAVTLAGENPTQERIEQIRANYGFDRPFLERYGTWLWGAAQGNLGTSILTRLPVTQLILQKLPYTLLVVAGAIFLALAIGIPLGMLAATNRGGRADGVTNLLTSVGVAVPGFWLSMILISVFALHFHIFPATGSANPFVSPWQAVTHSVLPAIALAGTGIAEVARMVRGSMAEILDSQAVRTLHAKGLHPRSILFKHGLRNVGVTLLTVTGLLLNRSLGATVVIEAVFAIPGIGSLIVYSALQKDFPVIQGVVFFMVVVVVCTNLVIDSLYAVLDPRLRG